MSPVVTRRTTVAAVVAVVVLAAVAGALWYRWYHAEEQRESRFLADLAAMPGVAAVHDLDGPSVELSPRVTPDEAVAVRSAVQGRYPGWQLTIGRARLDVDLGEPDDTRGATLLALVGNAGLTDDRVREVTFVEGDGATVFVTPVEPADELTLVGELADELADRPGAVPDDTRVRGDAVVARSDATADPGRLARDLAAVEGLAALDVRRITFGERCWVDVEAADGQDAAALWARVSAAVADAPCGFGTHLSAAGPVHVQGPSSSDPADALRLASDVLAAGADRVTEVTTDLTSVNATADRSRAGRVLDAAVRDVPGQQLRVHWDAEDARSSVIGPAGAARAAFPAVAALTDDGGTASWWQDEDGAVTVSASADGDDVPAAGALRRTSAGVRAVGWEGEAEVTLGAGSGDGCRHEVVLVSTDDGPASAATAADPGCTGDEVVRQVRRAWDATAAR